MKKLLIILMTGIVATLFAAGNIAAQVQGVNIHGFLSQGYLNTDENYFTEEGKGESFAFNEVGINFGQELTDELRIGIQLFARDFNDAGNGDIKIDWAFADYRFQDWMGLRFGQLKMPHGLYNEIRDIDMLRNPVFLPESVYQELSHDLYINDVFLSLQGISSRDLFLSLQGLGLYGFIDLDAIGSLSYQVLFGTQNIEAGKIRTFEKDAVPLTELLSNESVEVDYKYAGNALWDTPLEGLRLGLSLDNMKMSANSSLKTTLPGLGAEGDSVSAEYKKMENWVGSVEFTWGNMILMAEYIRTYKEYEIKVPLVSNKFVDSNPWGWYAGGSYRFVDWFELGGYYSETNGDNDEYYKGLELEELLPHPDFFKDLRDIAITARFDVNEYWAIKLEAHNLRGGYFVREPVSGGFANKEIDDDWFLYVAKMTVAF